MKHLDLFSGIGGFALACRWNGIETIGFVEIDKFCQKVLNKHWPEVEIVEDINDIKEIQRLVANTTEVYGLQCNKEEENREICQCGEFRGCDSLLLTGGFPCQPFSNAGRKRGATDNRYLWPQTLAVIEAIKPDWIVLENVPGILNMVFPDSSTEVASQASFCEVPNDEIADYGTISGGIDCDLKQAGYETVWLIIPACSLGAPHRRDRVWIVANRISNPKGSSHGGRVGERGRGREQQSECEGNEVGGDLTDKDTSSRLTSQSIGAGTRDNQREISDERRGASKDRGKGIRQGNGEIGSSGANPADKYGTVADTDRARGGTPRSGTNKDRTQDSKESEQPQLECSRQDSNAPNTNPAGLTDRNREYRGTTTQEGEGVGSPGRQDNIPNWRENWYEVATRFCRVDDGVPNRVERLKSLGNAIVPQVAYQIIKAIKEIV